MLLLPINMKEDENNIKNTGTDTRSTTTSDIIKSSQKLLNRINISYITLMHLLIPRAASGVQGTRFKEISKNNGTCLAILTGIILNTQLKSMFRVKVQN